MAERGGVLDWLERRNQSLILLAGVLASVTAALSTVGHLTTAGTDPFEIAIAPFAFLLLFLGVLGLYPRLADRTPRLARTAAAFAVIGALFAPLLGVVALADLAGLLAGDIPTAVLGSHLLGRHAGQVALVLTCVGIFRTGAYSRRVGVLLLGPAAVMLLALMHIILSWPAWATPPLVAANALAMLAIGHSLRTGPGTAAQGRQTTPTA